jgi:hypothetical protein
MDLYRVWKSLCEREREYKLINLKEDLQYRRAVAASKGNHFPKLLATRYTHDDSAVNLVTIIVQGAFAPLLCAPVRFYHLSIPSYAAMSTTV